MSASPGREPHKLRPPMPRGMLDRLMRSGDPAFYGPADVGAHQQYQMAQSRPAQEPMDEFYPPREQAPPGPSMQRERRPSSHDQSTQRGEPEIRIHSNRIPADETFTDRHDPHNVIRATRGPAGYGFYFDSEDDPGTFDFCPAILPDPSGRHSPHYRGHHGGHGRPGYDFRRRPSEYAPRNEPLGPPSRYDPRNDSGPSHRPHSFPYPPPPRQPSPPGPNDIDPTWLQWYSDTLNMHTCDLSHLGATMVLNKRVKPLLGAIENVPGPRAEEFRTNLEEIKTRCEERIQQG